MTLLFRFRVVVIFLLYLAGFLPLWQHAGGNQPVWLAGSMILASLPGIGLDRATATLTVLAACALVTGSLLRVWGTAYLGFDRVHSARMHADLCATVGPYRYTRNPLYLGSWLFGLGVSILMAPAGAAVFLIGFAVFLRVLTAVEERHLRATAGAAYEEYFRAVPRVLALRVAPPSSSLSPPLQLHHWLRALFSEIFPVGFTACYLALAWRYNAHLLLKCLIVSFGLSLVVHAWTKEPKTLITT